MPELATLQPYQLNPLVFTPPPPPTGYLSIANALGNLPDTIMKNVQEQRQMAMQEQEFAMKQRQFQLQQQMMADAKAGGNGADNWETSIGPGGVTMRQKSPLEIMAMQQLMGNRSITGAKTQAELDNLNSGSNASTKRFDAEQSAALARSGNGVPASPDSMGSAPPIASDSMPTGGGSSVDAPDPLFRTGHDSSATPVVTPSPGVVNPPSVQVPSVFNPAPVQADPNGGATFSDGPIDPQASIMAINPSMLQASVGQSGAPVAPGDLASIQPLQLGINPLGSPRRIPMSQFQAGIAQADADGAPRVDLGDFHPSAPAPSSAPSPQPDSTQSDGPKTMRELLKTKATDWTVAGQGVMTRINPLGQTEIWRSGKDPQPFDNGITQAMDQVTKALGKSAYDISPKEYDLAKTRLNDPISPEVMKQIATLISTDPRAKMIQIQDPKTGMNISNREALDQISAYTQKYEPVPYESRGELDRIRTSMQASEPIKNYSKIEEGYQSAKTAYGEHGPTTSAGMMGLVEGFLRMANPGASVRVQTVGQLKQYQPLFQKYGLSALYGKLVGNKSDGDGFGGMSSDELKGMMDLVERMHTSAQNTAESAIKGYIASGDDYGITERHIRNVARSAGYFKQEPTINPTTPPPSGASTGSPALATASTGASQKVRVQSPAGAWGWMDSDKIDAARANGVIK